VFNGDTAYITQLKQQKIKKVLLRRSTSTLWRRAAKVIAPFWFLLFDLCDVGRVAVKHFRLRNDLYCVEWGVKLYSLTHAVKHCFKLLSLKKFFFTFIIISGGFRGDDLWATDWRRQSRYSWYVTAVLYYGDTVASLSLQRRKTWYSNIAKLFVTGREYTKFVFGRGSAPDPSGDLPAFLTPLSWFTVGLLLRATGGEGKGKRGRKGKGPPFFRKLLDPPLIIINVSIPSEVPEGDVDALSRTSLNEPLWSSINALGDIRRWRRWWWRRGSRHVRQISGRCQQLDEFRSTTRHKISRHHCNSVISVEL